MKTFVVEIRSPTIYWKKSELGSIPGSQLKELKTAYVSVPMEIDALNLDMAIEEANLCFPNMVRRVFERQE